MSGNKTYTEEFKIEAVKRALEIGSSKVCKELGISSSTLHGWKSKYSPESLLKAKNKPSYAELEKEVKKLKKELGYINEINKILKKSTAIFSKDQIKDLK